MAARTVLLTAIVVLGPLRLGADNATLSPNAPAAARTVILARGLDAEQMLLLSSTLAAAEHPGVLLLDTPGARLSQSPLYSRVPAIGRRDDRTAGRRRRLIARATLA